MKNVIGSLLALLAVVSLSLSAPVSANPQGKADEAKTHPKKGKEPPKKGPATSQGSPNQGQPSQPGEKKAGEEG